MLSEMLFHGIHMRYEFLPANSNTPKGNMLLLHIIGQNMEEFDSLIPLLQPSYNILRYDLIGHGLTESPSTSITFNLLQDQLITMSNHFMDEKFFIIANPASGYVALRFCRNFQSRVSGLILISPPPTYLPLRERQHIFNQMKEKAALGFDNYRQFILSNITYRQDTVSISTLKAQFEQTTEHTYFNFMSSYLIEDFNDDFKQLAIPTLVFAGAHNSLFPTSTYGITASLIGAQFHVIPEAATLVAFDNPHKTYLTIDQFIEELQHGPRMKKGFELNDREISNALFKGFASTHSNKIMYVHLMDTFQVEIGGSEITKGWNVRKAKNLFLYLIFNKTISREKLIDLFWPNIEMNKARNHLRVSLSHLKSILNSQTENDFLQINRDHISLQGNIQCDALLYIEELSREYNHYLLGEMNIDNVKRLLKINPYKMVTHIYDDWFLHVRETIETQFFALCKGMDSHLHTFGYPEEAVTYEKKAKQLFHLG